jgi:hypothetical protein
VGSNNFFSKLASYDPLAQAFNLPGSGKYAQQQQQNAAGASSAGPYAGVAPTLAAANAGYAPGGPGSNPGYVGAPTQPGANPYAQVAQRFGTQPQNPRAWS